jgi:hypothetical protein
MHEQTRSESRRHGVHESGEQAYEQAFPELRDGHRTMVGG